MGVNVEKTEFQITAIDNASRVLQSVQGAMGNLKASYIALGSALAGGVAMTSFIADAASMRAALFDLSRTTGDSVQNLDGLRRVAKLSGVDMDQLGGSLTKLAKNLNSADDDGKAAGEAIKSVGLNIDEVRSKKPGEAMLEIALALNKFEDGAAKVAVAMALMGRSGAAMLPMLKDLAEQGQLNGKVTTEQALAAKELEKGWKQIEMASMSTKSGIATYFIPALGEATQAVLEAYKESGKLYALWVALGGAATIALGNTSSQRKSARLSEIDEQIRISGEQLKSGSLNPASGSRSLFSFLVPDVKLSAYDKFKIETTRAELQRERDVLTTTPEVPKKAELNYTGPDPRKTAAAPKDSGFDALMEGLLKRIELEKQSSEVEKINLELARKKYELITPAQRDELRAAAALLDVKLRDAEIRKADLEVALLMAAARKKNEDAIQAEADSYTARFRSVNEYLDQMKFETSLIGLSTAARERAIAARRLEADTAGMSAEAIAHYRERLEIEMRNRIQAEDDRALAEYLAEQKRAAEENTQTWRTAAKDMQRAMGTFFFDVMTGNTRTLGKTFTDMITRMLADAMAARAQLALFGPTFAKGGEIGGLAAAALKMLGIGRAARVDESYNPDAVAGGRSDVPPIQPDVAPVVEPFFDTSLGLFAPVAHRGRGPGDPLTGHYMPAALFRDAPRFHSGIGAHEMPALIRRDESVLTPGQMRQLAPVGSGDVHMSVNVDAGALGRTFSDLLSHLLSDAVAAKPGAAAAAALPAAAAGAFATVAHRGHGPGDALTGRYVPAALFGDAPRLHSGIGPDEMPAIIRRDESVLTPGQMKQLATAGSGGGVTVTMPINIDARGADAGAVARIEQTLKNFKRDVVPKVVDAVRRGGSARTYVRG